MSIGPIHSAGNYLQSVLTQAIQGTGLIGNNSGGGTGSSAVSSASATADSSSLSPFAKLASSLQRLQQSDPSKFQQVTQQISANPQNASQTAEKNGHPAAAKQLNRLANDFTKASQSGQLPNLRDLAQATSGHHRHHVHSAHTDTDGDAGTQATNPLLSALQSTGPQNSSSESTGAIDVKQIILNTLQSADLGASTSDS